MNNTKVYTKLQIRQMLQCSERTVERWVQRGILPKPILPGRWLKADVDKIFTDVFRHSPTSHEQTQKDS